MMRSHAEGGGSATDIARSSDERNSFLEWVSGLFLVTVLVACAQTMQSRSDRSEVPATTEVTPSEPLQESPSPQPDAVPLPAPVPQATRNDLVVLLPYAAGGVGRIVVRQGADSVLLAEPYAAAHIEGAGMIRRSAYDRQRIAQEFGPVLAALPKTPSAYLLYFLEGDDRLTAESESQIERIFADLATRSAAEISVIGHTDAMGTTEFNDKLSLQRAEKIRGDLILRGIPADSISIAGRGERELLVPTHDGIAEPQNRRVEINIR